MSSCACDPFAPKVFRRAGACACKRKVPTTERTAGYITPAGQPCAFGVPRRRDGRCPGDEVGTSGGHPGGGLGQAQYPPGENPNPSPAEWDAWTPDQRAAWTRRRLAAQGATQAEQDRAAERARQNDALILGLVSLGVNAIRDYFSGRTQERIAEIEARARVEIARINAQSGGQGSLLNGEGTNPGQPQQQQPAASAGGELMLIPLLMMMMR